MNGSRNVRNLAKITGLVALAALFGIQATTGLRSENPTSGVLAVLALILIGVSIAFLIANTERDTDER